MKFKLLFLCTLITTFPYLLGMAEDDPQETASKNLTLNEIICLIKKHEQNLDRDNDYKLMYYKIQRENEGEKQRWYNTYLSNLRWYKKNRLNQWSTSIHFHDIDNACPLCWGNSKNDSIKLSCCGSKFHISCMIYWMVVSGKKECALCNISVTSN